MLTHCTWQPLLWQLQAPNPCYYPLAIEQPLLLTVSMMPPVWLAARFLAICASLWGAAVQDENDARRQRKPTAVRCTGGTAASWWVSGAAVSRDCNNCKLLHIAAHITAACPIPVREAGICQQLPLACQSGVMPLNQCSGGTAAASPSCVVM